MAVGTFDQIFTLLRFINNIGTIIIMVVLDIVGSGGGRGGGGSVLKLKMSLLRGATTLGNSFYMKFPIDMRRVSTIFFSLVSWDGSRTISAALGFKRSILGSKFTIK